MAHVDARGAGASSAPAASPDEDFHGRAVALTDRDWSHGAAALACEEAVVRAVAAVESSGSGFLPDKRPKILFEAHIFGRLTHGRFTPGHPNISSPKWNRSLYAGGAGEYPRLLEAMALDESAALQSASWGRFQIMGFHFKRVGYVSVRTFVRAICDSERAHLDAFLAFVKSDQSLLRAFRAKNWAAIARHYNGKDYQANHYDTRMKQAYDRLAPKAPPQTAMPRHSMIAGGRTSSTFRV